MKITQKDIDDNWNTDMTKESFVNNLFINTIWGKDENLNIKINSQDIKGFCKKQIKTNSKNQKSEKPNAGNLNAIINVFEMLKLKQESTKESNEFTADQSALDKILNKLISEIKKEQINANNIINIINLQFYPAYRKLRLKEFLLQNHKRIAFEKDIFDSFSNKHISLMEGPFFWGIVENLHQGKKYWQYFMSNGAKEKLNLSEEQIKNLDVIHSAAKKSGSGIRLDHIIPRASLRTYFEMLCYEANKTSDEKKIGLINTKVNWIYPYLLGCLVTKDENNWLKEQINPEDIDEQELKINDFDSLFNASDNENYFNSNKAFFKTYVNHNCEKNLKKKYKNKQQKVQIELYYFKGIGEQGWESLSYKTKDVQKIIENAKKNFLDPKTQSD
jgi:hypothetical protein